MLPKMKNASMSRSKNSKSMVFSNKKGKKGFKSPKHKNFFEKVKGDQEKIHQFMSQSELQEKLDGDHIVKIIEKSKKRDQKFNRKLIDDKMKVRLMNLKNNSSLVDIRNTMHKDTQEQINKLTKKNRNLVQELNKVTDKIRIQKKQIDKLQNTLDNTRVPTEDEYNKHLNMKNELQAKAKTLQEKYISQKKFKDRMMKINKICEINQIQNEASIRKLNFYQKNLQKAIEDQKNDIIRIKADNEKLEEKRQELIEEYNANRAQHSYLLDGIHDEIKMKQYLNANLSVTNFLVNESVSIKKTQIKYGMIEQIQRENMKKIARDNHIRTKKVADHLENMREANRRVAILFQEGENGEHWTEKPAMKKAILEIEKKKDLERYKLEKKMELEKIEMENLRLAEEMRTLQEANKGQDMSQYDNDYVQMKYDDVNAKINEKLATIENCKQEMKECTIISDESNLIVSSIGRNVGVEAGENETHFLSEAGLLTNVKIPISCLIFQLDYRKNQNGHGPV